MAADGVGHFALVFHTHLPFVLGHGRWPHGSDWLMEVTAGCYLPLLHTLDALVAAGTSPQVTIDVSPVLAEQLAAPAFRAECEAFLRARITSAQENRAEFDRAGRSDLAGLADYWAQYYRDRLQQFERLDGDLMSALRRLQNAGHIEVITCAATHGYLPLLSRDESVDLQLRVATAAHRRHFGGPPSGIWLPECAYRPRYEWTPPVGPNKSRVRTRRRGIEELLAAHGLGFFFTDVHLIRGGSPLSAYRDYFPTLRRLPGPQAPVYRTDRSPHRAYLVASRGGHGAAAAFVRDPDTTLRVWSRDAGYPGDGSYLEFHKKHFPGGIRYWRVTDTRADLAEKQPYDPGAAHARTAAHAEDFVALLHRILSADRAHDRPPALVVSPYDTELFGHWWFEGPQWLAAVITRLGAAGITPTRCAGYLDAHPPEDTVALLEGSWGEGGDHRVWLNRDTEWTWERVYAAEDEFWRLAREVRERRDGPIRRILTQLARELLLLQASDWQFLITTWAARDYAEARVSDHHANFQRLAQLLQRAAAGGAVHPEDEEFLGAREGQNFLFADVAEHVAEACRVSAA